MLRSLNALRRMLARRTSFVEDEIPGLGALVQAGDVCIDVSAEYGLCVHALFDLVGCGAAEVVRWLADRGCAWRHGAWQAATEVSAAGRNYLFVPR